MKCLIPIWSMCLELLSPFPFLDVQPSFIIIVYGFSHKQGFISKGCVSNKYCESVTYLSVGCFSVLMAVRRFAPVSCISLHILKYCPISSAVMRILGFFFYILYVKLNIVVQVQHTKRLMHAKLLLD